MDRRCNKPDKTGLSANICGESRCHSPVCMAMHSGEIYQAQAARFTGELTVFFFRADGAFALNPSGAVPVRDVMVNDSELN